MEIREFFIIAFSDPQPLGTQSPDAAEHFTFLGYLRSDPRVDHKFTIAEHVERIALRRLELPGKKVKRLGRYMVTMLADPTEELASAKDELFAALIADGYRCSRPNFYSGDYKPHVSMGPATTPELQPQQPFGDRVALRPRLQLSRLRDRRHPKLLNR
jgi:hypothetical protein